MLSRARRKYVKNRKRAILLGCIVVGGFFLLGAITFLLVETPTIRTFESREVAESTKIYDSTGEVLLWEIHGEERRTLVPFDQISRHIKNASIAIEDASFYSHRGFSPTALFRVLFVNVFRGKPIGSGGSTITQQLVKNTLLSPKQTLTRKAKEIIIAIKLETAYSKDEILNLYLNQIPYGSNAYGVEAASETYFGKSSNELSLPEAAYLAALPKAPSYFSPYGNHRDDLEERKNLVLERMRDLNFINTQDLEAAKKEKVIFLPQKKHGIRAPHFAMYVRELLTKTYGEDLVERGGLKVITSLDATLQEKAEEIATRSGPDIESRFNASNLALIALDPKTGRILAMVGSRDYFDIAHDGNFNVTLAKRQPGSTFKPVVYATAFKKGYTPETIVFDLETNFAVSGTPYIPQNFDEKFRGPVTLREALAQSLNVPAVKTLYLAGVKDSIRTAEDFGISTLTDPNRYGLTLVLGGGEISLLELSSAYGVFANEGTRTDHHAIVEVRDHTGAILEEEKITSRQVLDQNIARTISSILSDNNARTPTFGARSPLYFEEGGVAVKTGTTNDYRDVWTIGYSPSVVIGAWAGNNNNTSMTKNVAGFIIAPLWREFMNAALTRTSREQFTPPESKTPQKPVLRGIWIGSRSYILDKSSGKLATEYTPLEQQEERVVQEVHSILHWVSKDNPTGPIPTNPEKDSQYWAWEGPVRSWALAQGLTDGISPSPTELGMDSSHLPMYWPQISFPSQEELGIRFKNNQRIEFHPIIRGTYAISEIDIFVDGEFIRSVKGTIGTLVLQNIKSGEHSLTLRVYDVVRNKSEKVIPFSVEDPGT
mgnify:FL=1